MLSLAKLSSTGAAGNYYEQDNYYARDDPERLASSAWFGRGADEAGLAGMVEPEQFRSILTGQTPNGPQLGRMVNGALAQT